MSKGIQKLGLNSTTASQIRIIIATLIITLSLCYAFYELLQAHWLTTALGVAVAYVFYKMREEFKAQLLAYAGAKLQWVALSVESEQVILTDEAGETELLPLSDLQAVRIVTNDRGPFGDDLFYVLEGTWGVRFLSGEMAGTKELFGLFDRLPNFDHQQLMVAMGSTSDNFFTCWQAPQGAL